MNTIDQQTQKIRTEKRIGLMTHLVIGYPDAEKTVRLAQTLADAGADFLELQIPFSDPVADGPTIMHACEQALKNGMTVEKALVLIKKIASTVKIPILIMAYYNSVFSYGTEQFCKKAAAAGVSGLIIPDAPIDEEPYEMFNKHCKTYALYPIRLTSPASTPARLKLNAQDAQGFVYRISRYGVTGSKSMMDPQLKKYLAEVKKYFTVPVGVGFGISKRDHVKALKGYADIAILGSAIIDKIKSSSSQTLQKNLEQYIESLI